MSDRLWLPHQEETFLVALDPAIPDALKREMRVGLSETRLFAYGLYQQDTDDLQTGVLAMTERAEVRPEISILDHDWSQVLPAKAGLRGQPKR